MKFEKGKSGNPQGRPVVKNKSLTERVDCDAAKAYKLLWQKIEAGESWAYELYFGMLKQKNLS